MQHSKSTNLQSCEHLLRIIKQWHVNRGLKPIYYIRQRWWVCKSPSSEQCSKLMSSAFPDLKSRYNHTNTPDLPVSSHIHLWRISSIGEPYLPRLSKYVLYRARQVQLTSGSITEMLPWMTTTCPVIAALSILYLSGLLLCWYCSSRTVEVESMLGNQMKLLNASGCCRKMMLS